MRDVARDPRPDPARRAAAALVLAGFAVLLAGSVGLAQWSVSHHGATCADKGMTRPLDGRTDVCLDAARHARPLTGAR